MNSVYRQWYSWQMRWVAAADHILIAQDEGVEKQETGHLFVQLCFIIVKFRQSFYDDVIPACFTVFGKFEFKINHRFFRLPVKCETIYTSSSA